jgi:hypothetical protein
MTGEGGSFQIVTAFLGQTVSPAAQTFNAGH